MANPQQPELARSRRTPALNPDATEAVLSAQGEPGVDVARGPIPVDNLPGHHPEHEQDKPDGAAFVAKVKELAAEAEQAQATAEVEQDAAEVEPEPRPERPEVVDLRQKRNDEREERANRIAAFWTAPLRMYTDTLKRIRDSL